MVAMVGYSVAGRSRGRVALCAVYTVHVEMRSTSFLVEPQNQGLWFVNDLTLKPLGRFVGGLGSKLPKLFPSVWRQNQWLRVSQFMTQNRQLWFSDLYLKITTTVS
jgi:hypothetical protein